MTEKPDWWPKNPYPIEIFPMPRDEYQNIVPDPHIRTALSGMLGREFWEIASGAIWDAMQNNADDENAEMLEALENAEKLLSPPVEAHNIQAWGNVLAEVRSVIEKAKGK